LLVERSDIPATKEERKTKRNELQVEKNKKNSQLGTNSDRQLTYRKHLTALEDDKKAAQRNYARRKNLVTVLKGDLDGTIIDRNGNSVKLSLITTTKTIKNYEGSNVSKKDINIGASDEISGDLNTLLNHAKTFFDRMITHNPFLHAPVYIESTSIETDFNGRR